MSGALLLEVGGLLAALVGAALFARRTSQSPIPFFILLGLFLEPPREAAHVVEFMATLGVSLLLFLIGLEFSPGSLARGHRRLALATTADLTLNLGLGVAAGRVLGFSWLGSLFLGGVLYVSSSGIIARGIIENRRSANRETEALLALLVVEDLVVAALLALLVGQAEGGGATAGLLGLARLALLLAAMAGAARVLRRWFWRLLGSDSSEVVVLFLLALVLLSAGAAASLGLSEAVGAFMAGVVVGETPYRRRVEQTLAPFQEVFAAMFFVAFGITIDPRQLGAALVPALALLAVFTVTKVVGGYVTGRSWRLPARARWRLGLSLTPRGEFSILLASVGGAAAADGARLSALAGAYVFLSAVTGALVLHHADRLARALARSPSHDV